jgi:hypothetical protein
MQAIILMKTFTKKSIQVFNPGVTIQAKVSSKTYWDYVAKYNDSLTSYGTLWEQLEHFERCANQKFISWKIFLKYIFCHRIRIDHLPSGLSGQVARTIIREKPFGMPFPKSIYLYRKSLWNFTTRLAPCWSFDILTGEFD